MAPNPNRPSLARRACRSPYNAFTRLFNFGRAQEKKHTIRTAPLADYRSRYAPSPSTVAPSSPRSPWTQAPPPLPLRRNVSEDPPANYPFPHYTKRSEPSSPPSESSPPAKRRRVEETPPPKFQLSYVRPSVQRQTQESARAKPDQALLARNTELLFQCEELEQERDAARRGLTDLQSELAEVRGMLNDRVVELARSDFQLASAQQVARETSEVFRKATSDATQAVCEATEQKCRVEAEFKDYMRRSSEIERDILAAERADVERDRAALNMERQVVEAKQHELAQLETTLNTKSTDLEHKSAATELNALRLRDDMLRLLGCTVEEGLPITLPASLTSWETQPAAAPSSLEPVAPLPSTLPTSFAPPPSVSASSSIHIDTPTPSSSIHIDKPAPAENPYNPFAQAFPPSAAVPAPTSLADAPPLGSSVVDAPAPAPFQLRQSKLWDSVNQAASTSASTPSLADAPPLGSSVVDAPAPFQLRQSKLWDSVNQAASTSASTPKPAGAIDPRLTERGVIVDVPERNPFLPHPSEARGPAAPKKPRTSRHPPPKLTRDSFKFARAEE